jgi:hypothetical protein
LRWDAERADWNAQTAALIDNWYASHNGHRDPALAARTATAEDAARAAWAKYKACLEKPACPATTNSEPPRNELFGLFALIFGGLAELDPPPPLSSPPPGSSIDALLQSQDLHQEDGNNREVPGHIARDEFGNLTFECGDDGCSATELPAQLPLEPATKPAEQPRVQPSNSVAPRTEKIKADIRYQLMGDWRRHGCIKYQISPIGSRSFGTIPLIYERTTQATEPSYSYAATFPNGQTFTFTLDGTTSPGPRRLAAGILSAIDWPGLQRGLARKAGPSGSGMTGSPSTSIPGELRLTVVAAASARNVAETGPVVVPSQMLVVGEDGTGTSARPVSASGRKFVLAAYQVESASAAPPLLDADLPSVIIYSIVSNGKSSGQALDLHASDPSGQLRRVVVPPGTVLEPVKQGSAKPVADHKTRGATEVKQLLTAYCLEFSKLPPDEGLLYRIAPQSVQVKFQSTRSVLHAAHKLGVDDDTTQYAVWTDVGGWDEQQFAQRFMEHSKKNAEAMNVKWTSQFESAVRAVVPERWRMVSLVLHEAAKP